MTYTYKSFVDEVQEAGGSREDAAEALGFSLDRLNGILKMERSPKLAGQQLSDAMACLERLRLAAEERAVAPPEVDCGPALLPTTASPLNEDGHRPAATAATATIVQAVDIEATAGVVVFSEKDGGKAAKAKPLPRKKLVPRALRGDAVPSPVVQDAAGPASPDGAEHVFEGAEGAHEAEGDRGNDNANPKTIVVFDGVSEDQSGSREAVALQDGSVTPVGRDAAAEISAIADSIRQHLNRIHKDVFTIGRALLAAKDKLRHGEWLPWLEREFGWTPRVAQSFMNVAIRFDGKYENISHLGVAALSRLAAPSTPDEVIERVMSIAESGRKVTLPEVNRLIHEFKPKETGKAAGNASSRNSTEEAFALLSKTLEPGCLQRLGRLLGRCNIVTLVAMIDRHDPIEEHLRA